MKRKIRLKIKYILPVILLLPLVSSADPEGIGIRNPLTNVPNLQTLVRLLLDAVVRLGAVVVVFMIIYSGFLFVKAQGNESELEKAKNTFLWTVIGAVILLGARSIAALIQGTAAEFGVPLSMLLI
jgi:hypothetical protein